MTTFHITARTRDQKFFSIPLDHLWPLMCNLLYRAHKEYDLAIHAFVLMGNHFHLLCHSTDNKIEQAIIMMMRKTGLKWEENYHCGRIKNSTYYAHVYKYIYQNPLRSKVVSRVQDYPFSTIIAFVNFPLHSSVPLGFGGPEGELMWLNEMFNSEDEGLIREGMKLEEFSLNKKRVNGFNNKFRNRITCLVDT